MLELLYFVTAGPECHRRDNQAADSAADQGGPPEEGIRRCRHRHTEHQQPGHLPEDYARYYEF